MDHGVYYVKKPRRVTARQPVCGTEGERTERDVVHPYFLAFNFYTTLTV